MKRFVTALLAICLLMSLAACGADKNDPHADPESDVVGIWKVTADDVTFYYDFQNGGKLFVYVDSYELKLNYAAEQKEDSVTLSVLLPDSGFGSIGVLYPDMAGEFTVDEGKFADKNRIATLKYSDEEDDIFTFTEVEEAQKTEASAPEGYQVDEALLDSWVNNSSTDLARQTVTFRDDGTMKIEEYYKSDDAELTITRNCGWTAKDGAATLTYTMGEETSLPVDYIVSGDSLSFGGMDFTREGVEIPTTASEENTEATADAAEAE